MRTALALTATALCAGVGATTLREAGQAAGIYMGSQFKHDIVFNASSTVYRDTHTQQYAVSTAENVCKWKAVHMDRGTYTLERCQESLQYAQGAQQKFRGHNLCWGAVNHNPAWLLGVRDPDELRAVLREHITTVMQGVPGAWAWDVVNEAVTAVPTTGRDWLKDAVPWYPAVPDFVDVAFRAARAADPDTLLFYNDFASEEAGTPKSDNVYNFVKDMVARGVPIDGVGVQMHIKPYKKMPNVTAIAENIARIGELGLQVHITEMDVACPEPCDYQMQADIYAGVLRACLQHRGVCTSFETWGFTDRYSSASGEKCPTGDCHPLPFDEDYAPKPAVGAMLAVLKEFAL